MRRPDSVARRARSRQLLVASSKAPVLHNSDSAWSFNPQSRSAALEVDVSPRAEAGLEVGRNQGKRAAALSRSVFVWSSGSLFDGLM